jgi:hypothetical protein
LGERHHQAKIGDAVAYDIHRAFFVGESVARLAEQHGLDESSVYEITRRRYVPIPPTHVVVERETLKKVREALETATARNPDAQRRHDEGLAALDAVEVGK